ncbi:uncharacterized protein SOCE26_026540 [Sorangium cellulosum]|uniref:Uncharacterized protein n=1 Tax=Sorangium cellulosum TaxID=56 RepID=A0A2L0EPM8_SORCE|nr:hypothetical protein [Sorangium cellulosum]AUX41244.1 uncharacterized protein SOCE26_026540 [Sorangium cellulosum]
MSQLGPLSRSIIEAARNGDRSTAADRARVRAKLRRSLALGTAVTAGGAAKTGFAMVSAKAALPWGIVALLAPAAVVAALHAAPSEPEAAARASTAGAVVAGRARAAAAARPAASDDRAPAESPREPAAPIEPTEGKKLDPPRAASERRTTPGRAPRSAPLGGPEAPRGVPAEDPLVAETRRLREVHESLRRGDPERALSLLDAADAGGQELREERAAARVVALCNLGKTAEGRAAMVDFLRKSPGSPYSDRVRAACEEK